MIIVYHKNNEVVEIENANAEIVFAKKSIAETLFELAKNNTDSLLIWCEIELKKQINFDQINEIFHHNKIVASYNLSNKYFLSNEIGYVEESPFIKINRKVTYPTWQVSSNIGGIHSSVLIALQNTKKDENFDYFLHSIGKMAMSKGLLSYSEPRLVKDDSEIIINNTKSKILLFRFVKQHYKTRWTFLLFLNLLLYQKEFQLFSLFYSLFYSRRNLPENILDKVEVASKNEVVLSGTIDVIIPTIGRKKYLYDVLKDLSKQNYLPKKVIVVEQNPVPGSISELDYLTNENWPFVIKHVFTHQAGACNARNIALPYVESEWVFMADDDIRITDVFLNQAFEVFEKLMCEQITFGCFDPNYSEIKKSKHIHQWGAFGSGCSIVNTKNIKSLFYDERFEFGFGEDTDFGLRLRNLGYDILYSPKPEITHLKAPVGGFRSKQITAWNREKIQPKPSPTVMLYKILHLTKEQINGYKTVLFFKYYKNQTIKNPFRYFSNFKKQWQQSLYWANQLKNKQ